MYHSIFKFPVGRIRAIVEDAAIGIVFTDRTLAGTIADELTATIFVVDDDRKILYASPH